MSPRFPLLLAALLLLVVAPSWAANGRRAPAAASSGSDSTHWRALGLREPWGSLALQRRFGAMDSLATARLAEAVARGERDSAAVAALLVDAVETAALAGRGREEGVAAQMQRALAIRATVPGMDSLALGRALRVSSELGRRRREFTRSMDEAKRSLAIYLRALPEGHVELAGAWRQVAIVGSSQQRGSFVAEGERALAIAKRWWPEGDPHLLPYWSVLAAQYNLSGDQVRALTALEGVLAGLEAQLPGDHPDISQSRYNVAVVAMRLGDLVRATDLLARVLEVESARPRLDSLRIATALSASMECLNDLGDHAGAEALHARHGGVYALFRSSADPQRYTVLQEIARTWAATGRAAEAAALYDSTIAFEARHNDSTTALPLLFTRAAALAAAGDTAAARRAFALAGAWFDRKGPRAPSFYEGGLQWARHLNDTGRPAEALARLDASLAQVRALLGEGSALESQLLVERARAEVATGAPGALATARAAARLRTDLLRTAARGFPDRLALVYAGAAGYALDPLLTLAATGRLAEAARVQVFEQLVESRSLVLDEVARRQHAALATGDPRAAALFDSLGVARAVLARRLVQGAGDAALDSLRREARDRAERFERALASLGVAEPSAAPADVRAALAPGDAMLSYAEYVAPGPGGARTRRLLAFVTRAGRAPEVVALGDAAAVDALVARWRDDATRTGAEGERRARASGARLRERVWDPLADRLAGARRLVLVPDGALHLVDLAALPEGRERWLAESLPPVVRLGAERDLALLAGAAPDAGTLVALGGADFDGAAATGAMPRPDATRGVACARFRDVRFTPLPGSAAEVEGVAARWRAAGREARALTGAGASEAGLRAAAREAATLHLATHGFFVGGECATGNAGGRGIGGMATADASAPAPVTAAPSLAAPSGADALRLAGLALAGANLRADAREGDDGILTAEEISALDLSRVREVVLSACDTGLGEVAAGEGVLGLQRAFRVAGARALVMSLWPVDDRATRDWMDAYYTARLERGLGVAASVRAAQLARLAALRAARQPAPPSAWAGFVGLGD